MYYQNVIRKWNSIGRSWKWVGVLTLFVFTLAACQSSTPTLAVTEIIEEEPVEQIEEVKVLPLVAVTDQSIDSGSVTISKVTSDGPGWLVVHAQAEGKPGPILGFSQVENGENIDVFVEIDTSSATETLYAMLHADLGIAGSFEFPDGPDTPIIVDGNVVTPPFKVTAGLVEMIPVVVVEDQSIESGIVTIDSVISQGPGWLVLHAQTEGKPGPILGYSQLNNGENSDVAVEIEVENATETLYAMLHSDAGEIGTFEFPDGPDVPAQMDGKVVTSAFAPKGGPMQSAVIMLDGNDELGEFLTGADGMTLYTFSKDEVGVTNCSDQCAANWPPLYLEEGQDLTPGEGISGELDAIERSDGGMQVTYNGLPLYFWVQDTEPGQATGHGVNEVWAVARADNPTVQLVKSEELGSFLVGSDEMTLYIFTKDQPGLSNCYDQCAVNWPPLFLGEEKTLTGGAGVIGELGITERSDGGFQITHNGWPLYYWVQDAAPGDTTGHLVNNVWFVAMPKDQVTQSSAPEGNSGSDSSTGNDGSNY